jgi:hypothetical protein
MEGTFPVSVPAGACVGDAKSAIEHARGIPYGTVELFVGGNEDALLDTVQLAALGEMGTVVLFMLQRAVWQWGMAGSAITLADSNLKATYTADDNEWSKVTGGEPMTAGRHYCEIQVWGNKWMFGAVRPGLSHERGFAGSEHAFYISGYKGALFGGGNAYSHPQGRFDKGDRVGMLLDFDQGSLHFFRNGRLCGPGFASGITGPLLCGVEMFERGEAVTVLPGAVAPAQTSMPTPTPIVKPMPTGVAQAGGGAALPPAGRPAARVATGRDGEESRPLFASSSIPLPPPPPPRPRPPPPTPPPPTPPLPPLAAAHQLVVAVAVVALAVMLVAVMQ